MHWKKKIMMFVTGWIFLGLVFSCVNLKVSYAKENIFVIDHGKNRTKAKKWAQKNYQAWEESCSPKEKQLLLKLLDSVDPTNEENNMSNINHQLKVYGGNLAERPIDIPHENNRLISQVKKISQVITRKEGRLEKPLVVYKNETLQQVLHLQDQSVKDRDGMIIATKIKELKQNFLFGQHKEFRFFDLYEDNNQNALVKWKIELPAGTPTGLITEDKIVIDKDSAFKVNEIKIIPQNGKQLIRIDAKLFPKENAENEMNQQIEKVREEFATRLNLPTNKTWLDFKLKGSGSNFIAAKLDLLLEKFISEIDPSLIRRSLQFMMEKEGRIIFSDQPLYTLPAVYEPFERTLKEVKKTMKIVGYYNVSGNRTVSIHVPTNLKNGPDIDRKTLFHEFGHVVDHFGAKTLKIRANLFSETPPFKTIFAQEGDKLTKYGSSNENEFFAEAFRMMHTPEEKKTVQAKAPQAVIFIQKVLTWIKEEDSATLR